MGESLGWEYSCEWSEPSPSVLLTYNPTGYSFYHWAMRDFASITAVLAFAGAILLVGWVVCIRTAFVSLGALGLLLSGLVLGMVWMLTDYGVLNPERPSLLFWITLIAIGIILGIGLSWVAVALACYRSGRSGLKMSCWENLT